MRAHFSNAIYGVLDYAAYPLGMLVIAPLIFRRLGAAQYGVWTIATAAMSLGSMLGSGFGDANIQQIATHRGTKDSQAIIQCVRGMIGLHLVTATVMALALWCLAPLIARHAIPSSLILQYDCRAALRFTCVAMWARTMETVPVSTQRAFEQYGAAVQVSLVSRAATLLAVAVLAFWTHRVALLIAALAIISCLFTLVQIMKMQRLLRLETLRPSFDVTTLRALLACGAFTWLQAASTVVFGQADRLTLGVSMGAIAVAGYSVCVQIAQPIYGITASGLHFLFPLIAKRRVHATHSELRRLVGRALLGTVAFILVLDTTLLLCGRPLLALLSSTEIASSVAALFPTIVCGSTLLALSVPATYCLLALGRVQTVTWIIIGSGVVMLLAMFLSMNAGAKGIAVARMLFGALVLLLYVPLTRTLSASAPEVSPLLHSLGEEA